MITRIDLCKTKNHVFYLKAENAFIKQHRSEVITLILYPLHALTLCYIYRDAHLQTGILELPHLKLKPKSGKLKAILKHPPSPLASYLHIIISFSYGA